MRVGGPVLALVLAPLLPAACVTPGTGPGAEEGGTGETGASDSTGDAGSASAGDASAGGSGDDGSSCVGMRGCACTENSGCDFGLICEDGECIDNIPSTTSGWGDGDGDEGGDGYAICMGSGECPPNTFCWADAMRFGPPPWPIGEPLCRFDCIPEKGEPETEFMFCLDDDACCDSALTCDTEGYCVGAGDGDGDGDGDGGP